MLVLHRSSPLSKKSDCKNIILCHTHASQALGGTVLTYQGTWIDLVPHGRLENSAACYNLSHFCIPLFLAMHTNRAAKISRVLGRLKWTCFLCYLLFLLFLHFFCLPILYGNDKSLSGEDAAFAELNPRRIRHPWPGGEQKITQNHFHYLSLKN